MEEINTVINKLCNKKYCISFWCCLVLSIIFINCNNVFAYKAISPAMADFITEEEEELVINDKKVNDSVSKKIENTNQSKFYEVILNEECDVDSVSYTKSYVKYANKIADDVLNNRKVYNASNGGAVITDKTKALSVVGINNFNVQLKYGLNISELELFRMIVQAEAGCEDLKGKILVANVILNRVKSYKFPNSIRGVVMAPGQFQPVTTGRIYSVKVSNETRLAVDMALQGEDYSDGALYFMARSASSSGNITWFDRALTRVVKHGNHEFFK